ncbi:hypothetical protein Tco_1335781 [Tanacetum coccineum]
MSRKPSYTTLSNPQGVIYEDKPKQNRFMRAEELHKFSDDTLISGRDTLSQMLHELHLGQNRRDLPRDIPLVRIEVRRYDSKGEKSEKKGIMLTETELALEQTQQDSHHGASDAMHNPPQPLKVGKTLVSKLMEISHISIDFLTSRHQSDTYVFTVIMEILPEPTSNKLCERLVQLRNPVKEILRNST